MSNDTGYGQSFATRLIATGRFEEALAEADKAIARDADDPEPVLERAQALLALERFEEGVAALGQALTLDRSARVLDDGLLDDLVFSSLLAWAKKVAVTDREAAVRVLARYGALLPEGCHAGDAAEWTRRLRGELTTTSWTKAR